MSCLNTIATIKKLLLPYWCIHTLKCCRLDTNTSKSALTKTQILTKLTLTMPWAELAKPITGKSRSRFLASSTSSLVKILEELIKLIVKDTPLIQQLDRQLHVSLCLSVCVSVCRYPHLGRLGLEETSVILLAARSVQVADMSVISSETVKHPHRIINLSSRVDLQNCRQHYITKHTPLLKVSTGLPLQHICHCLAFCHRTWMTTAVLSSMLVSDDYIPQRAKHALW